MKGLDFSKEKVEEILCRIRGKGVFLCTQLECNITGKVVTVGNIHVTKLDVADLQSIQVCKCCYCNCAEKLEGH